MDNVKTIEEKILNNEKLTEYELRDCAWGNVGEYIDEIELDSGRWTQGMQTIFKINEQLYCIYWERGLTECQDNEYWEQPYKVERKEEVVTQTIVTYEPLEE